MNGQKLWIDTDIGADVDDAIALSLALHSPQVELIGVTTVYKNAEERARVVKKLFSYSGTEIPVIAGSAHALLAEKEPAAHCLMYGPELEEPRFAPQNPGTDGSGVEAAEAIVRAAEKYGSGLALLAIGPLTNLAQAVRKAPAAMSRLGRVIIMGGAYFTPEPEWNVLCDPEAARVVFEAGLPLWCVGLDVTRKTRLSQSALDFLLGLHGKDERGYLADFARAWVEKRRVGITLHDPLALYALLRPDWLEFKKQRVFVETAGEMTRGFTVNMDLSGLYGRREGGGEAFIATGVRAEDVLRHCLQTVFGIGI